MEETEFVLVDGDTLVYEDDVEEVLFVGGAVWTGDTIASLPRYRKVGTTPMVRVPVPFQCDTGHGEDLVPGEAGDWVAFDSEGKPYPIRAAVQAENFVPVEDASEDAVDQIFEGEVGLEIDLPEPAAFEDIVLALRHLESEGEFALELDKEEITELIGLVEVLARQMREQGYTGEHDSSEDHDDEELIALATSDAPVYDTPR